MILCLSFCRVLCCYAILFISHGHENGAVENSYKRDGRKREREEAREDGGCGFKDQMILLLDTFLGEQYIGLLSRQVKALSLITCRMTYALLTLQSG